MKAFQKCETINSTPCCIFYMTHYQHLVPGVNLLKYELQNYQIQP